MIMVMRTILTLLTKVTPVTVTANSTNIKMIMLIYTAKRLIYFSELELFSDMAVK